MPKIVRLHEKGGLEVLRIETELPKQPGMPRPKIAKTFPFAETTNACTYLEANAEVGKSCDHGSLASGIG
jgi:hypothetical protein